ncbi:MAG: hypothetical protein B6244_11785 [Candidatus Cloacimonetes bacterium 4572_55]|nr:MAG: hypothetical protein B6244_11785 [Candidatus Cloacimonetes bacterium 4572_55]
MNSRLKTPWIKVTSVSPKENFRLELKWEDGKQSQVSLQSQIEKRDILWRLRNPRYFKQAAVDPLGGVFWPQGEDFSANYLKLHSERP